MLLLALAAPYVSAAADDAWTVVSTQIPASLAWDASADVSVEARNDGTTTWDTEYALRSVTGAPPSLGGLNRWGLTFTPAVGVTPPVAPGESRVLSFPVTAPPFTTMAYAAPVTSASLGDWGALGCDWVMWRGGQPVSDQSAEGSVVISRFADTQPGTDGAWARYYIEQCAGRVPHVVQGFPGGLYRPRTVVNRDAMAVFIRRAMKIPQEAWQGTFPDVAEDHWAVGDIEALAAAGIVKGFPGGRYHPEYMVTRDQMAVFVARAAGFATSPATEEVFPDVPADFWSAPEIKACVDHQVVEGYPAGYYHPGWPVARDQMAVFVYRAFLRPAANPVVLAGPAVTPVDPGAVGYLGWSSAGQATTRDPGYAYVAFDAVRLGPGLAAGDNGRWDIEFELRPDSEPSGAPVASEALSLTVEEITEARDAALASGDPYLVLYWPIPPALEPNAYRLSVYAEDEAGVMHGIGRQPLLTLRRGKALVLYDHSGPYGWLGDLYAKHMANLLGHFELDYTAKPVEQYAPGEVSQAYTTFYLGSAYDNPLPPAFLRDFISAESTVCWFKYNLWQVAWTFDEFAQKHGFQFDGLDWTGYSVITYKGETFSKDEADPELGKVSITDPDVCQEIATASLPPDAPEPDSIPYLVRGGKVWYVGDIPFSYISEEDRYLPFCDVLHDILAMDHSQSRRAIIRIEDVDPTASPADLRAIADYLYSEGVPFAVAVVPVYYDPLGVDNNGVPTHIEMTEKPQFVAALQYMVDRGGVIVQHGYTHQYDSVANPYNGVTGDDFEFFRVVLGTGDDLVYTGPVPEDSVEWAAGRAEAGRAQLTAAGFPATAWETPHYTASAADYQAFASLYPVTIQRVLYFTEEAGLAAEVPQAQSAEATTDLRAPRSARRVTLGYRAPAYLASQADGGTLYLSGQFYPYVIQRDVYGQRVLPENLGNVEPEPWHGYPARLPADIIRAAQKNLVIRDAWASSYFHHFYDLSYLQDVVQGIKALGYTFVPISADLR